jgi:uncharacterized protein
MKRARSLALVLAALGLAACAGGPQPRYYVLDARAAPAAMGIAAAAVLLEPVTIPAEVDRAQLVLSLGAAEVAIDDGHRWAAPLQAGITQALVSDLSAALGSARVTTEAGVAPWTGDRVAVRIVAFDSRLGRESRIDARWQLRRGDVVAAGGASVREDAKGGYDALVQAHTRALARVAREIAASVIALDDSSPVQDPNGCKSAPCRTATRPP